MRINFLKSILISAAFVSSFTCKAQDFIIKNNSIKVERIATKDSAIDKLLSPFRDSLATKMNITIGFSLNGMFKQQPESGLGNLIADCMLSTAQEKFNKKIDIALTNYGGVRTSLPKGDVTIRNIYEIMPFENLLVIQELSGAALQQLLDIAAEKGGWPMAGATMQLKDNKAINIFIDKKPLDSTSIYTLAINDYLANGGDKCSMLKPLPKVDKGILLRDALIDYIKTMTFEGKSIDVKTDKRITRDGDK